MPLAKTKLGVFGGTFNPIHNGHLALAEAVQKAQDLETVLFVPAARPPHKDRDLAPVEDRLEMVRIAVSGRAGFEVSDIEVARPGVSYTVDTLEALQGLRPDAELFFIIGEDSIPELPGWRKTRRILELARVVAVNRPGSNAGYCPESFPGVPPATLLRLERDRVVMTPSPLESRKIREAVRSGHSIKGQVDDGVQLYIERRGLYRTSAS
jgi:nicotinate-nucleotide adenylyltransferase